MVWISCLKRTFLALKILRIFYIIFLVHNDGDEESRSIFLLGNLLDSGVHFYYLQFQQNMPRCDCLFIPLHPNLLNKSMP
jgi:hypothetical protein